MSPALAGGFLTTAPPGKSHVLNLSYKHLLSFDFLYFCILALEMNLNSLKDRHTILFAVAAKDILGVLQILLTYFIFMDD